MTTSDEGQSAPVTDRQMVRTAAAILGAGWTETLTMSLADAAPVKAGLYLARKLEAAGLIRPEE